MARFVSIGTLCIHFASIIRGECMVCNIAILLCIRLICHGKDQV
ncbi:hypothetical protein SAMN05216388_106210 [Halorientalis persicus]|uniref:Uncharacterized protein n=1 Tax=Halorientalis persicus TaxID=1367881 RepID=A0A1H8WKI2_9EURY|nr:hypothetical protein SAMN05216388_106210 [Halorientalis persicus]